MSIKAPHGCSPCFSGKKLYKICILYNLTFLRFICSESSNYRVQGAGASRHKTTCKQMASAPFVYILFSRLQNIGFVQKGGRCPVRAPRSRRSARSVSIPSFAPPPRSRRECGGTGRGSASESYVFGSFAPFVVVSCVVSPTPRPPSRAGAQAPNGGGKAARGRAAL